MELRFFGGDTGAGYLTFHCPEKQDLHCIDNPCLRAQACPWRVITACIDNFTLPVHLDVAGYLTVKYIYLSPGSKTEKQDLHCIDNPCPGSQACPWRVVTACSITLPCRSIYLSPGNVIPGPWIDNPCRSIAPSPGNWKQDRGYAGSSRDPELHVRAYISCRHR